VQTDPGIVTLSVSEGSFSGDTAVY